MLSLVCYATLPSDAAAAAAMIDLELPAALLGPRELSLSDCEAPLFALSRTPCLKPRPA